MKNGANEIVGGGMPVDIRGRILAIRGVQVMLDRDLAELYDVPTGALNQAVKRNAKRFPDDRATWVNPRGVLSSFMFCIRLLPVPPVDEVIGNTPLFFCAGE